MKVCCLLSLSTAVLIDEVPVKRKRLSLYERDDPDACVWEEQIYTTTNDLVEKVLDNTWVDCFPRTPLTDSIRKHINALTQYMADKEVEKKKDDDDWSTLGAYKLGMNIKGGEKLYYKQFVDDEDEYLANIESTRRMWATDMVSQISVSIASILYTKEKGIDHGLYYLFPIGYDADGFGMLEPQIAFKDVDRRYNDRISEFNDWLESTYNILCDDHQGFDDGMSILRMTDASCRYNGVVGQVSIDFGDVLARLLTDCAECEIPVEITLAL